MASMFDAVSLVIWRLTSFFQHMVDADAKSLVSAGEAARRVG